MAEKGVFGLLNVSGLSKKPRTGERGGDGGVKERCLACGGEGVVGILDLGGRVVIGERVAAQVVNCPVCGGVNRRKTGRVVFCKAAEAG